MSASRTANVQAAEIVLTCAELQLTLPFFTGLGFRVDSIHPADDPRVAVISGYGVRLRLQRETETEGGTRASGVLRLLCRDPSAIAGGATELTAPNGTRIELVRSAPSLALPPLRPSFVLSRMRDAQWGEGRAGMRYRDLIPDRQGGRFVASHIQIPRGGTVEDYVHFHKVRVQLIYCAKGWVRLVYEDQGAPFVLRAGDCVLQPPQIRHRVLESSPGLEVIEISSPAEHETLADHELTLPTPTVVEDREFGGQRFVRHVAGAAPWRPSRSEGFEARDLGIASGTKGLANAHVVRTRGGRDVPARRHDAELFFAFVLNGRVMLHCEGHAVEQLVEGDAFVVPARLEHALTECSQGLEVLEVTVESQPGS